LMKVSAQAGGMDAIADPPNSSPAANPTTIRFMEAP
jgi:hypothetical protein